VTSKYRKSALKVICWCVGLSTAASVAPLHSVLAQTAPAAEETAVSLEEITVTARKREERLIDVPAAVSVVSGEALARTGTTSLENVANELPAVLITPSMGASTGAAITIRGFGTNASADGGVEQAVSMNFDNVSSARGRLVTTALFDLNDVEVLKGPQALYFGKNSPAGVVVVTSKDPTPDFEGYGRISDEFEAEEYRAEGAIGGPINDVLGFRLAAFRSDMVDGYVKNTAGPIPAADSPVVYEKTNDINILGRAYEWGPQSKQTAARLSLSFKPADQFDAMLKLTYSHYRDNGDSSMQVNFSCPAGSHSVQQQDLGSILFVGPPGNIVTDPYGSCGQGRFQQSVGQLPAAVAAGIPGTGNGSTYLVSTEYLASLTANYRPSEVLTLTSVTGLYTGHENNFLASDLTTFNLIPFVGEEYVRTGTEELRLASSFSGPFNFTAGAFYSNDRLDTPFISGLILAPDPRPGFNENYSAAGDSVQKGSSYSGFAELRYQIVPTLELAVGARYTREKKDGVLYNSYVNPIAQAFGVTLAQGVQVPGSIDETNTSPQATLTWKATPDVTLYGAYRTGFKSGGIIHPGLIPASVNPALPAADRIPITYNQEKVHGGEIGTKFQLDGRRLTGTFTLFDYQYKGLQVSAFDSDTGVVYLQNAGSASSKGVEQDLAFQATTAFSVHTAFTYMKAAYDSFANSACWDGQTVAQGCTNNQQNLTGRPLTRAPRFSSEFGFTYDQPITSSLGLALTGDVHTSGAYYTTPADSPYAYEGGYTLFDAGLRLHQLDNKWDVLLISRNLGDKFYGVVASDKPLGAAPGSVYGVPGIPRTILLQATYHF
jgi:iron complex outermembrane recepter protein